MGRARRARKVAVAAALGGGGLTVLGGVGVGVISAQLQLARRTIGTPFGRSYPDADGHYHPPSSAAPARGSSGNRDQESTEPIILAILGDSLAAGLGADSPEHTPGSVLARELSTATGRPIYLTTHAVVGARSADLHQQIGRLNQLAIGEFSRAPDVAVIMAGANDVTHRVRPAVAVRHLTSAVELLLGQGCAVVVGTCPDLGTIEPVPQPLRAIARRLSRDLAAAQTVAVVEAGACTVSLGNLLDEDSRHHRQEMFSSDRFHPSSVGYAAVATVLLPAVTAAVNGFPEDDNGSPDDRGVFREQADRQHRFSAPHIHRYSDDDPVASAAASAAQASGTEMHAQRRSADSTQQAAPSPGT